MYYFKILSSYWMIVIRKKKQLFKIFNWNIFKSFERDLRSLKKSLKTLDVTHNACALWIVQNHAWKTMREDPYYEIIFMCVCWVCVIRPASVPNKRIYRPRPREIGILPERAGILRLSERVETNRAESRWNRSTRAKHWKQLSNPRNRTVATVCAIWPGPSGGERQIVLNVQTGKAGIGIFEELLVLLETICANL